MSHISSISSIPIKDLAVLERELKAFGLELVRNQTSHKAYGRQQNPCEHAIRVIGAGPQTYEVGLVTRADGQGYELKYDGFAGGYGLMEKAGPELRNIFQAYSLGGVRKLYGRTHKITSTPGADGKLRVHLEGKAMATIDIVIGEDGSFETIEVGGVEGPACLEATKALEQWAGGKLRREVKPEMNGAAVASKVGQGGGL